MLYTELSRRLEAYREIKALFGFLTDFLTKLNDKIKDACKFIEHSSQDIDPEFIDEMVHFKYFVWQLVHVWIDKAVPAK